MILLVASPQQDNCNHKILTGQHSDPKNTLEREVQAELKDGTHIKTASGYRSFNRQRELWNCKYDKYAGQGFKPDAIFDKIEEYSKVPGTSRYHWGTDMYLIDGDPRTTGDVLVADKFHVNRPFCKVKE